MNQIKISIIMTVYETGFYLDEALKTIFDQSFQEFEIICVDDCSKDKLTRTILQEYQNKHENMKILWCEENIGPGNARNLGFSQAKGEYTIFLDADDMFTYDFLEKMYQCIKKNNADVCLCGYKEMYINNGKRYFRNQFIPEEYKVNAYNKEDWFLNIPTSAWNKLCRTQFLREHRIFFQSIPTCNDVFFSCMVMINAKNRCYVKDTPLIFYRINLETQISANRNPLDLYQAVMYVYHAIKRDNIDNNFLCTISALLLRNGIWEMKKCKNSDNNRKFYQLLHDFFLEHSIEFHNKMLMACKDHIINIPYESKWIFNITDGLVQLKCTKKKLKKKLVEEKIIYLWGLGYRGNIFQAFCLEEGIALDGITDKKNQHIGQYTEYGNRIINSDEVLNSGGLIIASNCEIYQYLLGKEVKVFDLSEYYIF